MHLLTFCKASSSKKRPRVESDSESKDNTPPEVCILLNLLYTTNILCQLIYVSKSKGKSKKKSKALRKGKARACADNLSDAEPHSDGEEDGEDDVTVTYERMLVEIKSEWHVCGPIHPFIYTTNGSLLTIACRVSQD